MKWLYSFLGILFFLFSIEKGHAQQVEFRCTQVSATDDIILTWTATWLPPNYQYEIYRSPSKTGTYTLIATIPNLSIFTYTDVGAYSLLTGLQQWFYTIVATPKPPATGTAYNSDTIANITFILNSLGAEIAELIWTHPCNPPLPTQAQQFDVLKEKNGTWGLWMQTPLLTCRDTVHVCGEMLGYEIHLYDSSGCESISVVDSKFFTDLTYPTTPQLDSVSIDPATGKTHLGWNPSSGSDVFGYFVYIYKNGILELIDTVFGANTTYYIDTNHDANTGIQRYRIAAIDTCFNPSPIEDEHNTLLLSNNSTSKCDSLVSLSWNKYINMPDSVSGYRIFVSVNGSPFFLLDTVDGKTLSYTHRGANPTDTFIYYVQAYNLKNGYSSSSSKVKVSFNYTASSGDVWMRYASVVDDEYVEIAVFALDTISYNSVFLFKSDDGISFSKINSQAKTAGTTTYLFADKDVSVTQQTYYYAAALTDECDNVFVYSDTANNIVLSPKDDPAADEIAVEWKPYYGFRSRLDNYDVLRKTQTETVFQAIANVSPLQLDYTENVWNVASQGGKLSYRVCANEGMGNRYGFQDKSYSNTVEIAKEPVSYIPNMFRPNSEIAENRVFKPVHSYVNAEEYVFSIFDRWGSRVFYTNDITEGWDGSFNGKMATPGVYTYIITYRIDKKNVFKKQGRVTLIR